MRPPFTISKLMHIAWITVGLIRSYNQLVDGCINQETKLFGSHCIPIKEQNNQFNSYIGIIISKKCQCVAEFHAYMITMQKIVIITMTDNLVFSFWEFSIRHIYRIMYAYIYIVSRKSSCICIHAFLSGIILLSVQCSNRCRFV